MVAQEQDNLNFTTPTFNYQKHLYYSQIIFSVVGYTATTVIWIFTCMIIWSLSRLKKKQKRRRESKRISKRLINIAIFACSCSLLTFSVRYAELAIIKFEMLDIQSSLACEVYIDICTVIYCFAFYLTNIFFWYRVHLLYSMQVVKSLDSNVIKAVLKVLVTLINVSSVVYLVAYIVPKKYEMHKFRYLGCYKLEHQQAPLLSTVTKYSALALKIIINVCLFFLLYRPLRRLQIQIAARKQKKNPTVLRAVKSAFIGLIISIVSDCFDWVVTGFLSPHTTPVNFRMSVWDINLFFNVFSMVICFEAENAFLMKLKKCFNINDKRLAKESSKQATVFSDSMESKLRNSRNDSIF